jgi:3-oxoacyl-[acyl-carrier protein] reductase
MSLIKAKEKSSVSEKSLEKKVALVTGSAKRIGRSIALRLAAEGADVIVNYRNSESEAEEVVAQIKGMGRRALSIQADVTKRAEVRKMFETIEKEFG